MRLIDNDGNIVEIDINDVTCIKRDVINRKTMYRVGEEYYYEPNTITQLEEVNEIYGFRKIDKNKIINLNKVDKMKGNKLFINGAEYLVSRRLVPQIRKYLK